MVEPISALTAIGTTFKFAEFCLKYIQVDSDNHVFLALITRVRRDLDEAHRERREKEEIFKSQPRGKRAWIDGTILDTQSALHSIGILIESARIDLEQDGTVNMKHRFEWVLGNYQKFISRQIGLATCHRSLIEAINVMHNLQAATSFLAPPEIYPAPRLEGEPIDDDPPIPRSPSQRRPNQTRKNADQSPIANPLQNANAFQPSPRISRISDKQIDSDQVLDPHPIVPPYDLSSDVSPPTWHPLTSPSNHSAPVLPEIPKYAFCFEGYILTDDPDEAKALSAAADALDAHGSGLSNISLVPSSRDRSNVHVKRERALESRARR